MNVKFVMSATVSRVNKYEQKNVTYVNLAFIGGETSLISACPESPPVGSNVEAMVEADTGTIMAFNRPQCVLFPRRLLSFKLITGVGK